MEDEQDTEQADEEQQSVPETDENEEAELDISTLPDQAQEYIHELREESKSRRQENAAIKKVFDTFTPNETQYLLDIIGPLGGDDEAMKLGAEKMQVLALQILGEEVEKEVEKEAPSMSVEERGKAAGLTEAEIRSIVQGQTQQDKDVARIHKQTEDLGFELGTDAQRALWDLAVSPAINGDLTKAANALEAIYPELMPEDWGVDSDDIDDDPEEEEEAPSPRFAANAAASGAGKTAETKEDASIPLLGSDELRAKVRARMEAAAGE